MISYLRFLNIAFSSIRHFESCIRRIFNFYILATFSQIRIIWVSNTFLNCWCNQCQSDNLMVLRYLWVTLRFRLRLSNFYSFTCIFDAVNISDYLDSQFYNNLDHNNINHTNLYKKIVNSFENFKHFIKNNNFFIDYTYLWDIITTPNKDLFPKGINLIILEITDDDITDNVNFFIVLCDY